MKKWFRIVNPGTGAAYIFDLDEVKASSKTKGRMTILLKGGGTIVIRARGKAKWLRDAWKEFQANTIGVPCYWALRTAR